MVMRDKGGSPNDKNMVHDMTKIIREAFEFETILDTNGKPHWMCVKCALSARGDAAKGHATRKANKTEK